MAGSWGGSNYTSCSRTHDLLVRWGEFQPASKLSLARNKILSKFSKTHFKMCSQFFSQGTKFLTHLNLFWERLSMCVCARECVSVCVRVCVYFYAAGNWKVGQINSWEVSPPVEIRNWTSLEGGGAKNRVKGWLQTINKRWRKTYFFKHFHIFTLCCSN